MFNDFATQVAFTAIIYFAGLVELGAPWWKSFIISILVFVCCHVRLAPRWIMRGGVALAFLASAVWLGALPAPLTWTQSAFSPPWAQVNTDVTAVSANPNTQ